MPFTADGEFCFHKSNTKFTYCNAQKYCYDLGGELVNGNANFEQAKLNFNSAWIGLTDFKTERKSNRNGWLWSNGELLSNVFKWDSGEPGNSDKQDCVIMDSGKDLEDKYCSYTRHALCHYNVSKAQQRSSDSQSAKFNEQPVLTFADSNMYANLPCVETLTFPHDPRFQVMTCAKKCLLSHNSACKTFFVSQSRKECRLVLYNDASLELPSPALWRKFVRIDP